MKKTATFARSSVRSLENLSSLRFLSENILSWQEKGQHKNLSLEDVVGVSAVDLAESEFPGLVLHAYPITQTNNSEQSPRVLTEYRFTCSNEQERSQWQQRINAALASKLRHFQVIINPVSGKKQALNIFEQVRPLLDKSYLTYSVREACSSEDIKSFVSSLNLATVDGLIVVGGDGTVHDAIAGLMSRPDWQKAIELPLGIIPGGTGNGLSKSLLESAGEAYNPLSAAFLISKGKQQNLDLAIVKQNSQKYYSFLSLAWGLISDVDIESERLKFLGSLRFDLYALLLICMLRTYKGKFSFIPHPDYQEFFPQGTSKQGEWHVIEDDFIFLWGMNTPWAAHDMNVTPHARLDDGAIDILIMRKGTSRLEILQALLRCGKGKHLNLPHMEYYKVRSFRLEPLTKKGLLVVDGELVDYSPIEMEVLSSLACVNS
ncbi:MAG: diacylglycerol kinase family protein [Cyanobacteria bacterium P01_G01_bin.19]